MLDAHGAQNDTVMTVLRSCARWRPLQVDGRVWVRRQTAWEWVEVEASQCARI